MYNGIAYLNTYGTTSLQTKSRKSMDCLPDARRPHLNDGRDCGYNRASIPTTQHNMYNIYTSYYNIIMFQCIIKICIIGTVSQQ